MDENYHYLESLLERITYKPDFYFLLRRIDDRTALLSLQCKTLPNAVEPGKVAGLTINNTILLAEIKTPSHALQAFAKVVADLELHEAAEFFQLDRERIFLPHGWDDGTDEIGGFAWSDFTNLSGKFLRALKHYLISSL
ncbi:hypothetical protein [Candidatus Leptofilum sp.]|uniref:hypothetical protein n=1 Tax=Candidatus Leptofilum sp. TaxID=3241576 RepID=UPI003B5AC470